MKPLEIWIRKKDAQIGIGVSKTIFGDFFLFADYDPDEVLNSRFCQFLEDDNLTKKDFIVLGYL